LKIADHARNAVDLLNVRAVQSQRRQRIIQQLQLVLGATAFAAALATPPFVAVALRGAGVPMATAAAVASGADTGAAVVAVKFPAASAALPGFACGSGVCANRNSAAGENSVIWLTVNNPAACAAFGAEGVNWSSVAAIAPLFALVLLGVTV
jgi:hypothetical protein